MTAKLVMRAETNRAVALADLLATLGEPTRLRIMNLLRVHPLSVCDLQNVLNLSEPLVSRHLARLRFGRLVTATREGNRMLYDVAKVDSPAATLLRRFLAALGRQESCLQADLRRFHDLQKVQRPHPSARNTTHAPRTRRYI